MQRHPRVRGLDHRRMEVGGGGPRRAAHDRGPAASRAPIPSARNAADRSSSTTWTRIRSSRAQRERERCRPRPRRDDRVGATRPRPLVDERPRERGRCVPRRPRSSLRQNGAVPIVFVPGFTQTAAVVAARCRRLAAIPRTPSRSTSSRSRRRSPRPRTRSATHGGPGVYVGYSMGGRLCLRLALDRPDLVRGLVLVSASPGLAHRRRTRRARRGRRGARRRHRTRRRRRVPRALARAADVRDRPGRTRRPRRAAPAARPSTSRTCLRVLGTGAMEPLWDRLAELQMPVLLVTGTRRREVRRDRARDGRTRSRANAAHVALDGGHALPLEQPGGARATLIVRVRRRSRLGQSTSPTASSAASTSWKRTVPISAATSDGASWWFRTSRIGRTASGAARSASSAGGASTPHATTATSAPTMHTTYSSRARAAPDAHRERPLAGDAVGVDVAHVVGEQDRARRQADGERTEPRRRRDRLVLHVRAADRRDEAEEHEHHHFAEPDVAVRLRAAGVGRRRRRSRRRRRAAATGSRRATAPPPTTAATPKAINAALRTAAGDARPLATSRTGPAPVRVGAAHAVGVVVRVVDADLQRERRRRARPARATSATDRRAVAAAVPTSTGAIAAPERLRPRARDPLADRRQPTAAPESAASSRAVRAHGRFGNWSKSGVRFSRYAFLPSCASSVM